MIAPHVGLADASPEELQRQYEEYRLRQGRALVFMLPPDAVRPLMRRAHAESTGSVENDPLGALARFCMDILPLPPFDIWLKDVRNHPGAYVQALGECGASPTVSTPATLEARRFERGGRAWVARLRAFRDRETWRGFIAFQADDDGQVQRTSLVFREEDPQTVRERFLSFETATLESFLRSATP